MPKNQQKVVPNVAIHAGLEMALLPGSLTTSRRHLVLSMSSTQKSRSFGLQLLQSCQSRVRKHLCPAVLSAVVLREEEEEQAAQAAELGLHLCCSLLLLCCG